MKTLLRLVLITVLAALPLWGQAGENDQTTGSITVGAWDASTSDSPDMVAEYETDDGGPDLMIELQSFFDGGSLFVNSHVRHSDDADTRVDFDIGRMVRSHTSYTKLLHRLGHDPMTNLEATSTNHKVVFPDDHNPDMEYDLTYAVLDHRTEIQLAHLSALTFAFEYRDQHREGHRQAFAVSHCDTCHVNSMSHPINEHTTDATIEAKVAWSAGSLKGRFTSRELTQNYTNLTVTYDDALHPALQVPVFDNRLQYDSAEGPQAVDVWPDIDKDITRLELNLTDVAGFVVHGGGVWSETENRYTGLKSEYSGYVVSAARKLGDSWRLSWRGKVYSIDNDDVFVDSNERLGIAGPQAGLTYREIYGFESDWWRYSAMNRDAFDSDLDLSYRLGGKAGTLKFQWDMDTIDREHYEVAVGDTETTKNVVGVSWRGRPANHWKVDARLRHADIDNPFMALDAACSTLVSEPYPNPWNPDTAQYYDFHNARVADTTAVPSEWDEARLGATYFAGRTTFSGSYRYWDGSNSDGDLTDWSRTNQSITATLWSAPAEHWEWYLGYTWLDSQMDAPACIPIFDG